MMRTTVDQFQLTKETAYAIGCFVGMQKLAQDPDPAWLDQTIKDITAGGKEFRPRKHLRNVYLGGHKRNLDYRPISTAGYSEVDDLRRFVGTLITSDDNAVARLPSGRTFFSAGARGGRHDMSFRSLRTRLLGEARPERAYAIAEKLHKDPLLGKRIEEAIAGKQPIKSIRMPRGTTIPQRGAVTYFSTLKEDPTVVSNIKEKLVDHLRRGRIDDPAKLIKDVGYTQPSNVQSILRRVYNRRGIYDYMRQSGFPRLKSLSAAFLKKDRRLAAILGSLTALTGGSYAGYRALQKEPTPVVPDDQKKKKKPAQVDEPKRDSTPSTVAKDKRKKTP